MRARVRILGRSALLATLTSLIAIGCFVANAHAAPSGAIAGTVTDAVTHNPIENLEVCAISMTAEGPEEESAGNYGCAKSGTGGDYTISGLNPGSYAVIFGFSASSALNYVGQAYDGISPPNEPTPVVVKSGTTGEINAELQEGSEISGRITNAITGAPVEGVIACALRAGKNGGELAACARSAANGEYTIRGVPDGEFNILFLSSTFALQLYPGKESPSEASVVTIAAPKEIKTGIDAAMQPGASLPSGGGEPEPGSGPSGGGPTGLGGLPGGGPLGGPLGGPRLPVALNSPRIGVEHRAVALVKLACAGATRCRGKLVLSIKRVEHRRGKTLTWTVPLGAERYSLREGADATVKIRLDAHARALLRSGRGSLQARLTIALRVASKTHVELQSVVLTDRKPAAGH